MKIVSTDKVLIVNDMNHDLKIISIMLNRISKDTMLCVSAMPQQSNVCMLIVSELAPPLPHRSTAILLCVCAYDGASRWRCAFLVGTHPHRHDRPPVGWSGACDGNPRYQVTRIHRDGVLVLSFSLSVVLSRSSTPMPTMRWG